MQQVISMERKNKITNLEVQGTAKVPKILTWTSPEFGKFTHEIILTIIRSLCGPKTARIEKKKNKQLK
jgi:hypothetical protein